MGGERAGSEEESGKEALLRGAETPAPHCGRRCQVTARWPGPALHCNLSDESQNELLILKEHST